MTGLLFSKSKASNDTLIDFKDEFELALSKNKYSELLNRRMYHIELPRHLGHILHAPIDYGVKWNFSKRKAVLKRLLGSSE